MAGRLASDDEMPDVRHSSVFINRERSIQFSIKVMSDAPDVISGVQNFTCWANHLPDFQDDIFADNDERIRNLRRYLDGKIILFKPVQRTTPDTKWNLAQPITVLDAPEALGEHSHLVPILYLPDFMPEEFEQRFFGRHPVGGPYNRTFPKEMPIPNPITVWVGSWLYGPFDVMRAVYGGWMFRGESVRKIEVNITEFGTLILPYRNIVFIETNTYEQVLVNRLESEGMRLQKPDMEVQSRTATSGGPTLDAATGKKKMVDGRTAVDVVTPMYVRFRQEDSELEHELSPEKSLSEAAFLRRLQRLAHAKRLFYDEEDLVNFHTALKTGNLVLLAGMSGTGKSRLVQLYADALGMDDEQFAMISVCPTWTDDSDVLGFLDLTNGIYRPSDSGLVDLLIRAYRNPDKLYMVCFDEMNLARVEHYFSQFISALELEPDHRFISLYTAAMEGRVYNSSHYPSKVPVGRNVMFVGTVNVDESTYAFSDRVLDRAQVIRLRVLPFSDGLTHAATISEPVKTPPVSFATYDAWRTLPADIKLSQGELEFLERLHNELQSVDLQRGVGHRTVRQIDTYLQNIPLDDDDSPSIERSLAFDLQVVQKVVQGSSLIALMDEFQDLSSFTLSRQEIKQKARELKAYGYAS
ncbi:MAG: AAA family ATPase [Firmicutes bacterium]|nr:AAA family ATPase [Bacillota bacterium]